MINRTQQPGIFRRKRCLFLVCVMPKLVCFRAFPPHKCTDFPAVIRQVNGPWFDHVLEWWEAANADPDHILFLQYEAMLAEPAEHIRKIADFAGIEYTPEIIAKASWKYRAAETSVCMYSTLVSQKLFVRVTTRVRSDDKRRRVSERQSSTRDACGFGRILGSALRSDVCGRDRAFRRTNCSVHWRINRTLHVLWRSAGVRRACFAERSHCFYLYSIAGLESANQLCAGKNIKSSSAVRPHTILGQKVHKHTLCYCQSSISAFVLMFPLFRFYGSRRP